MRRRRNGPGPPAPPPPPPPPPFVPQDVVIDLGTSGEKLTLQTTEAGGFTRNGEAFASGTTVEAAGNTYRLTLESGTWSAAYEAPNPWAVPLGRSGEALLITRREDGLYEGNGNVFESGGIVTASNGNQYTLTFADGRWTSAFLPPEPVPVGLGRSGEVALVTRTEGGSYQVGGQAIVSGSIVRSSTGATYRLVMQDGAWTATFEPPPPVVVSLPGSTQTVLLQLGEDGNYTRNGQPFASGSEITVGGEAFLLTLQNGRWTAVSQAPVLQMVTLGTSGVTLTLQRSPDGSWTEGGETVQNGEVRTVGNNRYRLLLQDGEWSAEYRQSTIPVDGAGGLIVLFQEEDGTLTYEGETVRDGSVITQGGRRYELFQFSDGSWLASPTSGPPPAGDQTVSLPGGQTVTLRRTSSGTFTYNGNPVSSGSEITVGANRYRLTQDSNGTWTATAVSSTVPPPTVNPGTIGGPTQVDRRDDFTDGRLNDDTDPNEYGVQFVSRSQPTERDSGTMIVPMKLSADTASGGFDNEHQFSVYELMQSTALAPIRRTAAEVAKASLGEIIAEMDQKKPLYNTEAVDSGTDIGGTGGLWEKAQDAVGRIFGYTRDANSAALGDILGDNPWRGARVDPDEVDDVISALQRMVGVLSDAAEFAAEFEQLIEDDTTLTNDADDFFSSIASRVRFGSTNGTRFGAYAVTAGGTHAAGEMWDTGVFLYTPLDEPRASEIPTRGSATFNGATVAVLNGSGAGGPNAVDPVADPQLYAGKISLDVSFSQRRVTGTVTDLKDEDGDPLRLNSNFTFRDEIVASITLPVAIDGGGTADLDGLYTSATDTLDSTISFGPSLQAQTSGTSTFRVQLVDDATEALGIWRTGAAGAHLEGAFGATRSGSVTTPRLPTESDRGSSVAVSYQLASDGVGTFTDTDSDGKFTFALTQANIGGVGPDDGLSFQTERLYSSSSHPERGGTYMSEIRSAISRARSGLTETNRTDRIAAATAALERISSGFPDLSAGSDLAESRTALTSAASAISSERNFYNAVRLAADRNDNVDEDGFFETLGTPTDYTQDQIRTIFAERTIDFRLRTARTTYTRFGVWSQRSAATADGTAVATSPDIENGSFAFGPRAVSTNTAGLRFVANYSGRALAVETVTGNLYGGSFELRVNWADNDTGDGVANVSATITDLRGIDGTSSLFRHDNRDVKSIFLTGINEDSGGITSVAPTVRVRYTDTSVQDADFTSTGSTMEGGFIGDSTEGPTGVLGTWSIPADGPADGTISNAMRGSFGADLRP